MAVTLHTSLGKLRIQVDCDAVPKTAENFLALCASSYYTDSLIYRVIPTFMFQTGAPANPSPPENPKTGSSIWGGGFDEEIELRLLRHSGRGIVSMANRGPGTSSNASQFFITFAPAHHLDGQNTVFGRVLMNDPESAKTMDLIEAVEVDAKDRPLESIRIKSVDVEDNPMAG